MTTPERSESVKGADFACVVLPDTEFVKGLDGMLYCRECFDVLWPDAVAVPAQVTQAQREAEWSRYA